MRRAIIADVHGNLEALEAVLADIDTQNVDRIICLGDVIGYGADPERCMDLVRERCDVVLMGNHEYAVLNYPVTGFREDANKSVRWNLRRLEPIPGRSLSLSRWGKNRKRKAYRKFLSRLPKEYKEGNVLYVHGAPRDPISDYLYDHQVKTFLDRYHLDGVFDTPAEPSRASREAEMSLEKNFGKIEWLCFNAHSHKPGVLFQLIGAEPLVIKGASGSLITIDKPYGYVLPRDLENGTIDLTKTKGLAKVVVGVGSGGQSRDCNTDACYTLFDGGTVTYRRVSYAFDVAAEKIRRSGLPLAFATRLEIGE